MDQIINLRKKVQPHKPLFSGNKTISWEADCSLYSSPKWRLGLGLSLIGAISFFIIFKQGLISIIFLVLLLSIFVIHLKKPKITAVSLFKNRVQFGQRLIPYQEIDSFWIVYEPRGLKELSLRQRNWHSAYLKIPIQDQDPIQIRNFLLDYIPEERHEDSIFDILGRKFGI